MLRQEIKKLLFFFGKLFFYVNIYLPTKKEKKMNKPVYISEEIHEAIKEIARKEGRVFSKFVEAILKSYLASKETKK